MGETDMANAQVKQERIDLRLQRDAKRKIMRAASFEGEKISQFVLVSALERAEKTIHEHEVIALNARDSEAFLDALKKPVRFNKVLNEALESHEKIVSK